MKKKTGKKIDLKNPSMADVTQMLSPKFDPAKEIEGYDGEGYDLQELVKRHALLLRGGERIPCRYGCGSSHVKNTPAALYRLLWAFGPKRLDFSDMYKSGILEILSKDRRFLVMVDFFKYEIGLYFYCPKKTIVDRRAGQTFFVSAGHPGSESRYACSDPEGVAFFKMIKTLANSRRLIYGGNDFSV